MRLAWLYPNPGTDAVNMGCAEPMCAPNESNRVIPVLVIGAGPHALAFAARFLDSSLDPFEESPWNTKLFKYNTAEQRVTYRFPKLSRQLRSERDQVIQKKIRHAEATMYSPAELLRVVDTHRDWLEQWQYQFNRLEIQYLRSSASAHVDPVSWEALSREIERKSFTQNEPLCRELRHVPRTDSYHGPFIAPSAPQFFNFCKKIIQRYNLESIVEKASAESIAVDSSDSKDRVYTVHLSTGETVRAQHVVLALGPQREPIWPDALIEFKDFRTRSRLPLVHSVELLSPCAQHEWTRLLEVKSKSPTTRVLVIGGGLTSAHLMLVLHKHFSAQHRAEQVHLTLVARDELRIQAFDIDIPWMGRTRGHKLAQFWSERDFERRAESLKEARNGGASISPEAFELLVELQRTSHSQVEILESTEVVYAEYLEHDEQWHVEFQEENLLMQGDKVYDYIVCATGTTTSLAHERLLSAFHSEMDFTTTNQANLTPELRVAPGQNIYVLGDSAALQLGPGAVNLMGARAGAARVARAIKTSLGLR